MNPSKKKRTQLRLWKKGLLALVLFLVSMLSVEGLCRCWLLVTGQPQRPTAVEWEMKQLFSAFVQNIPSPEEAAAGEGKPPSREPEIPHPYVGFEMAARVKELADHLNDFIKKDSEPNYVILVVGGSVSGRFAVYSSSYFLDTLRKDPRFKEKKIHLINMARAAHKQPQQVSNVAYLLCAGYKPDAIIDIDGFNEVAIGFWNGKNNIFPLYPGMDHWMAFFKSPASNPRMLDAILALRLLRKEAANLVATARRYGFKYSALLSRYATSRLKIMRDRYAKSYELYLKQLELQPEAHCEDGLRGPPFDEKNLSIIYNIVRCWYEASRSIDAMCDARGMHYLHVLQPTLHDQGSKPVTEEERRKGTTNRYWKEGVHTGYPLLRQAGEALSKDGVPFYDASMLFENVEETIYFDCCHFGGIGNEIFGKAVGMAFLNSLPPP